MKRVLLASIATLLLVSCSSGQQTAEVTESEATDPNVAACNDYETLTSELADMILDPTSDAERLENIAGEFDTIALSAEGDVKTRMLATVETIPEHPATWMVLPADDYFNSIEAVARACMAATDADQFAVHTWS